MRFPFEHWVRRDRRRPVWWRTAELHHRGRSARLVVGRDRRASFDFGSLILLDGMSRVEGRDARRFDSSERRVRPFKVTKVIYRSEVRMVLLGFSRALSARQRTSPSASVQVKPDSGLRELRCPRADVAVIAGLVAGCPVIVA